MEGKSLEHLSTPLVYFDEGVLFVRRSEIFSASDYGVVAIMDLLWSVLQLTGEFSLNFSVWLILLLILASWG